MDVDTGRVGYRVGCPVLDDTAGHSGHDEFRGWSDTDGGSILYYWHWSAYGHCDAQ
jgi:hypothetical protein